MRTQAQHTQGTAGSAPTRDGRSLFYMQLAGPTGSALPTVVFESGLAATRSYWALIQPKVAEWTRAVVYDRSGLGRGAPDTRPRTLERLAGDLNDLLDQLRDERFILVAHSGGGPIIRAATAARPERIVGLVLLDVTDEACDVLFEPSFRRLEKVAQNVSSLLARLGLLAPLYREQIAVLPDDARTDFWKEAFTPAAMRTRGAELTGLVAAMNALRTSSLALPDIPVTMISGALADGGMSAAIRAATNVSHACRVAQSPQGRHVIAPNSGHMVLLGDPDLVVSEIRRILDIARSDQAV